MDPAQSTTENRTNLLSLKLLSTLENAPVYQWRDYNLSRRRLHNLPEAEKDTLLRTLFEQGQLTRHQALALTRKEPANTDEIYQYWLTPEVISPFIEQARSQLQQEQAAALVNKMALEKAEKEKALTDVYNRREHYWQQSQEQADRTCASGYDAASRYLHQLFEAYQFKADEAAFEQRFKRFVVANNSRKALLNRLSDLL